jgi:hypothetical protein
LSVLSRSVDGIVGSREDWIVGVGVDDGLVEREDGLIKYSLPFVFDMRPLSNTDRS